MLELRRRHFPDPWGRPSQGREESVEAIELDDIRGHFTGNYRPNGAIIGVAGNFEWSQVRDHVARLYGDWAAQPAEEPAAGQAR